MVEIDDIKPILIISKNLVAEVDLLAVHILGVLSIICHAETVREVVVVILVNLDFCVAPELS